MSGEQAVGSVNLRVTRRSLVIGGLASAASWSRVASQEERNRDPVAPSKEEKKFVLTPTEQLMHSTVMIKCEDNNGNQSTGTGFIFLLFNHNNQNVPVLVTNKHVIKGATRGVLIFTEATADNTPNYGKNIPLQITDFSQAWVDHPALEVDLTILPLTPFLTHLQGDGKRPFFIGLDQSIIPTGEGFRSLTPVEDVLIVGYPDGISDTANNVPVFRRGISATPPFIDFMGKREFLIDAAIFPGSSGSPVFLFNQGAWTLRDGNTVAGGYRIQLLGIVYAVTLHKTNGEIVIVPAPTQARALAVTQIPNNLGLCIKSSRLLEFEPILIQRGLKPPDGYKLRDLTP
jgi:V8-like Glu-specific endopeptidase